MAHDGGVVRQPDVLGVVLVVGAGAAAPGRARSAAVVDHEGALDVDPDVAWPGDGRLYVR